VAVWPRTQLDQDLTQGSKIVPRYHGISALQQLRQVQSRRTQHDQLGSRLRAQLPEQPYPLYPQQRGVDDDHRSVLLANDSQQVGAAVHHGDQPEFARGKHCGQRCGENVIVLADHGRT
jgi:hypothetical protein